MGNPSLSIIIPTRNEKESLLHLFSCLENQTYKDFQIIVADNSDGATVREICENCQVNYLKGGLPAVGRNNGAQFADCDLLFFIDADVSMSPDFIQNALRVFYEKRADCLSFGFKPASKDLFIILAHKLAELYFKFTTFIGYAHGIGGAILVKRTCHLSVGGFDESIFLAEDVDYCHRISKMYNYYFISNLRITLSVRRFNSEGKFRLCYKWLKAELYRITRGEIRHNNIPYFD